MSLGISTLNGDKQILFYDITANMDSYQSVCLNKLLGIKAKQFAGRDVARELGAWIDQHVLKKEEDYCDLLEKEWAKIRKNI